MWQHSRTDKSSDNTAACAPAELYQVTCSWPWQFRTISLRDLLADCCTQQSAAIRRRQLFCQHSCALHKCQYRTTLISGVSCVFIMRSVCFSSAGPSLRRLVLSHNNLTDRGLAGLARGCPKGVALALTELGLEACSIGFQCGPPLASILQGWTSLQQLTLSWNDLGLRGKMPTLLHPELMLAHVTLAGYNTLRVLTIGTQASTITLCHGLNTCRCQSDCAVVYADKSRRKKPLDTMMQISDGLLCSISRNASHSTCVFSC